MFRFLIFVFFVFSSVDAAQAREFVSDEVLIDCVSTPRIEQGAHPGDENIPHTNNLRRKTGIALVAKGEPIYLIGRVVDEDCVPIDNAEVQIWQTNSYGKYQFPLQKGDQYDENFMGSGISKTDNLGKFSFLTIYPTAKDEQSAPMIHFRVKKEGFEGIETVMFFPEEEKNESDSVLEKFKDSHDNLLATLNVEARDGKYKIEYPESDRVYQFNITLVGKNKFREY